MKSALLLFSLFISVSAFSQSESIDTLALNPTRVTSLLATKSVSCVAIIDCFPWQPQEDQVLGPDGSKLRGNHYESLSQTEQINSRNGLRGQYSHYYINGIRVRQDFTPGEVIEDIDIFTGGTPAFDEGTSIFSSQDPLLIY